MLRNNEICEALFPAYRFRYASSKNFGVAVSRKLKLLVREGKLKQEDIWYGTSSSHPEDEGQHGASLKHSERLVSGLEVILAEDRSGWLEAESRESSWAQKIEQEGTRVKRYAEQHLKTGYPPVYRKMKAHQRLLLKLEALMESKGYSQSAIDDVVFDREDAGQDISTPEDDEVLELMEKRAASYSKLDKKVRELIDRVTIGKQPLKGHCTACQHR